MHYNADMVRSKDEIKAYLENRMTIGEEGLMAMTLDQDKRPLPTRSVFLVIDKYIRDFKKGISTEPRWIAIPGLRGVGKTTLVAQLYTKINCPKYHKIYISLDEASRSLGVSIKDVLSVYEEMLGTPFEKLIEPAFIFLDEVQYDETWGITLKTLYDRAKNVFIVCTGSSALSLQTNPDIARRVVLTKIHPLNFTEYEMIKDRKYPLRGLGSTIKGTLFNSKTAGEVYEGLLPLQGQVDSYWLGIKDADFENYLKYGTLPFTIALRNEPLIYSQINQTLNSVLNRDVPQLNAFDKQTVDKLSQVLYMVASYDTTSFNTISQSIGLDIRTVGSIFDALEKTELLLKIFPYAPHEGQVRKASKFLFSSPAFRSMYYNLVGSTSTFEKYKGKLFEDVIGLYLYRIFSRTADASITYDSAQKGADFIIGTGLAGQDGIVIEASLGDKSYAQVYNTMEKTNARYGFTVSPDGLKLADDKKCLSVPLKYFLLI